MSPVCATGSNRRRHAATLTLLTAVLVGLTGCALKPIARVDLDQTKVDEVRAALDEFRADERLARYFEQAAVIAVYPFSARAATGVGVAWGRGLVFDHDGRPIGHTRMWQLTGGPQLGAQIYRQVLFFRTREAYDALRAGPAEFAGQVNAAATVVGVAATPSFNADVALFTQLRGGLLLEASVSAHRYDFGPITD